MYLITLLGLWSALAAPAPALKSEDCHVFANEQRYTQSIYGTWSWGTYQTLFSATMQLLTDRDFTLVNDKVVVSLSASERSARIHIRAPGLDKTTTRPIVRDDLGVGRVEFTTVQQDEDTGLGASYSVSCSLGLNTLVDAQKAQDEAEMDRLGPAAEWSDPQAPSLAQLPVGTVLELTRDIEVQPGTDRAETTLVESNGLLTQSAFWGLNLPYRFAYAEFFNANNGYIKETRYPQGMRVRVQSISRENYTGGSHGYVLTLRTLSEGVVDPITWMKVSGRRSGRSDVAIPQFAELLAPAFKIVAP